MKRKKPVDLYLIAAVCFYLAAVFQVLADAGSTWVVYLLLGTVFTVLSVSGNRKEGPPADGQDGGNEKGSDRRQDGHGE